MASGAQVSEEAEDVGGTFGVASSNQVTEGTEGVPSSNQLAEGTEEIGGVIGVSPTNQVTGEAGTVSGETVGGHAKQAIEQTWGIDGEIGEVQVTGVGGLFGEVVVASDNQITREPGGVGCEIGLASDSEVRATSVNNETEEEGDLDGDIKPISLSHVTKEASASDSGTEAVSVSLVNEEPADVSGETGMAPADEMIEPGGTSGNIEQSCANHVKGEAEASGSEIRAISVNHETEKAGDLAAGIKPVSLNHVTEEASASDSGTGAVSVSPVNGEPADVGGEAGMASANELIKPGDMSGKIAVAFADEGNGPVGRSGRHEMAYANEVNGDTGGAGGEVGVASSVQLNGKPEGQIGGTEFSSAYQVNEEPGDAGGENSVAYANQLKAERGRARSESGVASANQMNGPLGGEADKFGFSSEIQVNGEPRRQSNEIGSASGNQMSEEPGGDIGLVSANQVEPGGGDGEIWMPSSNQVNGVPKRVCDKLGMGEKHRWVDTKVYRRRPKGEKNKGVLCNLTAEPAAKTLLCNGNGSQNDKITEVNNHQSNIDGVDGNGVVESEIIVSVPALGDNATLKQIQPETASIKELISSRMAGATPIHVDLPVTNGALRPSFSASGSKVRINLASTTKVELRELKRKFENELYSVRKAVKRIDGGRGEVVPEFFHPVVHTSVLPNGARSNGFATRVYSGTRSLGHVPYKPNIRPFNQLRVSVVENGHCMVDSVEREKRTPKANQFYRNSEFLLANDKFPPAESNKKSKSNGKKSGGAEFGFGVGSKVYKSCSALLEKLMKHKHGWVFNAPVDVNGLGLHDYFLIIKNPMDLGTVKAKLMKYWYKSPMEFAEDIRLTFHNAMLYNPIGHDVHIMAETLLKIFEGKWPDIEVKYLRELRMAVEPDVGYPTPTSRISNPFHSSAFPPLETRVFNRTESMPHPVNPKPRTLTPAPPFRTPALKKPKAKDVNKRDMTYDEKQKLSTNLQSLPPEKLDGVIQIIKKRSTALSQNDDEIEVDIDIVDTETLWELDRFVTNYKKSLSKIRRKAELANQMRAEARLAAAKIAIHQPLPPKESTAGYGNATLSLPPHQNNPAANDSGSSSSSSSSSSGSSSSDSDSDSSSEDSDGERSPGT